MRTILGATGQDAFRPEAPRCRRYHARTRGIVESAAIARPVARSAYGGQLRQLDAQFLHDWPEVRQELIERLLALPTSKT